MNKTQHRLLTNQSGFMPRGPRVIGVVLMVISLLIIVPLAGRYTNSWSGFWMFMVLIVPTLFIIIHSFADFLEDDDNDRQ